MKRLLILAAAGLLAGCGAAEVGDACDHPGARDECVDGAICDDVSGGPICLPLCDDDHDCERGHDCNGVSNSNRKACHAKD